jgi:CBS domain containing-hemolysin-like protein
MSQFRKLPHVSVAAVKRIERPSFLEPVTMESAAEHILTDFQHSQPLMLEQSTGLELAREMMRREHVKLKLVIDSEERFTGLVSLADLLSAKVMQAAGKTALPVDELTVGDIMTPRAQLHAIDYRQLCSATIGDVVATMQSFGDQHVLVVDPASESLRGLISASDIARTLKVGVEISARACSFAQIYEAVHG